MSRKTIVGEMCISRDNQNSINIEMICSESNTKFAHVRLTAEQFGMMVTGAYQSEIRIEVKNLERVGKKKVIEARQMVHSEPHSNREAREQYLIDNAQEEGWILNPSLRSQQSVQYRGDAGTILCYSVYKYIDIED